MFDCLLLDPFSASDDCLCSPEVGVGRRDVSKCLVVAMMVVMLNEGFDLAFQVARQEVVFEQDAIFERLVPAFDLALALIKPAMLSEI